VRTGWEICQFELRQQLKSPFVFATLIVFFIIHLLTITSTGINLWTHPLADINSAYAISVTETTLAIFGMLPVMVFVAKAILRDHETTTAALFFVKPIHKLEYLGGRFVAACLLAVLTGLVGLLGTLVGTLMPWLDQEQVASFSFVPFVFCFFSIVLPTMLIQCALFFSAASLTRSLSATVATALVILVTNITVASYALGGASNPSSVLVLADHTATVLIAAATRNWTVTEFNTVLPTVLLLENRLLWLAIAACALAWSFLKFSFEVSERGMVGKKLVRETGGRSEHFPATTQRVLPHATGAHHISAIHQFASQLRIDLFYVLRSPLFLLVLVLGAASTFGQHDTQVSPLANIPFHPVTSIMLVFFRYGLLQFILILAIFYSGALLHRERESAIGEIVGATPAPDWVLPLSKTLTLCVLVALLLLTTLATSIAIQAASGYTNFEVGLYLQAVFVHNGSYFWMLCVLAFFIQTLVANKWLGMLSLFALYVLLFSLGPLGFEHVLYGFAIPYVVHSDMNGFDQVGSQIQTLIVYWTCFCGLLMVAVFLLYPRGVQATLIERAREARRRFSWRVKTVAGIIATAFIAVGCWIFYNTNVLNSYQTTEDLGLQQASYELKYEHYDSQPSPSYIDLDIGLDLFPSDRRMESRGRGLLKNNKSAPIAEFILSVNPKLRVIELDVGEAKLVSSDVGQGVYSFKFAAPLQIGQTVPMSWRFERVRRGFANSGHDVDLVRNGSFLDTLTVMPVPGFDQSRKVTDNPSRKKLGLKPSARLPELGDPRFLDKRAIGIGSANIRIVMSTDADQIAVATGVLKREWREGQRHYFEYVMDRPTPPMLAFLSGRYEVAKDRWGDTALEVYYDPKHALNARAMLATAKLSLEYFSQAFSPYQYSEFRIVEYPRYRTAARAFPAMTPYSEAAGFVADLTDIGNLDYATIHEFSHMWWGGQASGATMQGRELLNETLAQYSTLMVYEKHADRMVLNRLIEMLQRGYLVGRGQDSREEHPLIRTDDQGNLSYNKGPLAIYALRELLGEDAVNRALRNYLAKFAFKPAPFPTSLDLVAELRAVAGPEYQALITDLFEKIVLYDLELAEASTLRVDDGYEVTLKVNAKQLEASGRGRETEVPLNCWFDVVIFSAGEQNRDSKPPLYLKKHALVSGANTITIRVAEKPGLVSVDPYRKMADRRIENNTRTLQ